MFSAGILLFRLPFEVFLVHPGGPFWAKKDDGAWSIPKGEYSPDEDPLSAAIREFEEETGYKIKEHIIKDHFISLRPQKLKSGKIVHAWAVEGNVDASQIRSNTFEMEWPPRSGKMKSFPEVDRAAWFDAETARKKINERQVGFVDELEQMV